MSACPGLIRVAVSGEDLNYVTLILLALALTTILVLTASLIVLHATRVRSESVVVDAMESGSEGATVQQSSTDFEASPTVAAAETRKVRWASLYSYDMTVEHEVEVNPESLDGANLRRSTLLIHISPESRSQH